MADSLERRWNEKLTELAKAEEEYSAIGGPRSAADFGDEIEAEGDDWTNGIRAAWALDAKPTHPGAAGGTVDQNWAKTLPREAGWSICGVTIEAAKWKFRSTISRFNLLIAPQLDAAL